MTTRESGLKDAYETVGEHVPALGDIDLAIRTARRRRLRTVIGVPLLAAAAAVAVVLSLTVPRWSAEPEPAGTKRPPVTVSFTDWVPNGNRGAPAELGSLIYRDCADCPLRLRRPDGQSFALSDLKPDLADKLPATGMTGLYLSWNGRWLGVPRGTAYEFHDLAVSWDNKETLPAGPRGSRWKPVGTGIVYSFARWEGDRVTAYAYANPPEKPEVYKLPKGYDRLPVRSVFDSVVDAVPVGVGERVIVAGTDALTIRRGQDPGSRWKEMSPDDFGLRLRRDETLIGPCGVPTVAVPISPDSDVDRYWQVATVYSFRGGAVVPSAVLRLGAGVDVGRIEIPAGWELLGPLDRDQVAMSHRTDEGLEVVALGFDGKRRVLHRLGPDAEVLLPGIGR
ncbi:hypothetical protein [Tenggerimyces flavus]|uniref:Uncharacterized protein n=1 Tax=Tenggerimyces flavus TaxID=1708749 RepID=A0ABV7YF20_9ACTN|nr:hypothetical protein [Tenggerimyces flavus]MBM7786731.1 hypothetical protein [Tenggerimyces flavus]